VAALSPREFSAFTALYSLPRTFVPRRELHRTIFGEAVVLDRRVDRLIWNVRRKLQGAGFDAGTIRSVHAKRGTGGGYLLQPSLAHDRAIAETLVRMVPSGVASVASL